MAEYQIFNLEKIRELTSPIEELKAKLNNLEEIFEILNKHKQILTQNIIEKKSHEIQEINISITDIYKELVNKTIINLQKFLIFQENLVKNYKESFNEALNAVELNKSDIIHEIGLFLIKNKNISKVIDGLPVVHAIDSVQWLSLLNSLKYNTKYLSILQKSQKFLETQKVKLTERLIKEEKEVEKSISLLDEQPIPEVDKYQEYMKYSKEEFRRRRRRERRESLETIEKKPETQIEVNEDVTKKIKEFKSRLGSEFNEKYLIQKDDQQDPISLIRELKKKREDNYKSYINKIKDKKKK